MGNLFVSFEIAKQLKEKGFYESCRCAYNTFGIFVEKINHNTNDRLCNYISAPNIIQTIDWFRNKHKINIDSFTDEGDGRWIYINYKNEKKQNARIILPIDKDKEKWAVNTAITEALKLI